MKGSIERVVFRNECVYNNGLVENLPSGQNAIIFKNNLIVGKSKLKKIDSLSELDNHELTLDLKSLKLDSVIDVSQFNREII